MFFKKMNKKISKKTKKKVDIKKIIKMLLIAVMLIALPLAVILVQKNQENRSKAVDVNTSKAKIIIKSIGQECYNSNTKCAEGSYCKRDFWPHRTICVADANCVPSNSDKTLPQVERKPYKKACGNPEWGNHLYVCVNTGVWDEYMDCGSVGCKNTGDSAACNYPSIAQPTAVPTAKPTPPVIVQPAGIKQDYQCSNARGKCQNTSNSCSGGYLTGFCPSSAANIKCCVGTSGRGTGAEKCVAKYVRETNGQCQTNGGKLPPTGGACTVDGKAGSYQSNLCSGQYNSGYRCCVAK